MSAFQEQAICRIYRIGQMNPVTVHRLVVKDTVEEAIVKASVIEATSGFTSTYTTSIDSKSEARNYGSTL